MYSSLLFLHSLTRWLVTLSLVYALFRASRGYLRSSVFTRQDNALRHRTATFAHIQLMIGVILYFKSPIVKFFYGNYHLAKENSEVSFFAVPHMVLMLVAVILLTIGSAKAKRQKNDREKFKTMMTWFAIALLIILIAVPWPFSPLAGRPYFRHFI